MIGAGVFTTSGFSFADLGDPRQVMFAWMIGGVIATCGAISYGQLAQRITESGGEYLFLSRLIHPSIGFIAGWVSLLAGFTGAIAFAATAFESYALPEPVRPSWYLPGTVGVLSIILFGLLHSLVLRSGLVAQNVIVSLKLVLLLAFVAYAFSVFPSGWPGRQVELPAATEFSVYAIASTLVWISLSFSGFNAAAYVTGEVANAKQNVPRSMVLGTLVVTVFYVALNYIFLFGPLPEEAKGAPDIAAVASQAVGGTFLSTLVRIIVSVALLSSVSSMIIAGPRVYAKMASDGVFPNLFRVAPRDRLVVPAAAIWLQVGLACLVVCVSSLKSLLDYLGFTLSVTAAVAVACIFWTRRENDTLFHRLVFSAIALVYVAATLALAVLSAIGRPQQLIGFGVTVASGIVLYLFFRRLGAATGSSDET